MNRQPHPAKPCRAIRANADCNFGLTASAAAEWVRIYVIRHWPRRYYEMICTCALPTLRLRARSEEPVMITIVELVSGAWRMANATILQVWMGQCEKCRKVYWDIHPVLIAERKGKGGGGTTPRRLNH